MGDELKMMLKGLVAVMAGAALLVLQAVVASLEGLLKAQVL